LVNGAGELVITQKPEARIAELKKKLAGTDYAVVKIAEGAATAGEYAEVIAQRAAWRQRIAEIEEEI
jgi:hypothetical protein